ncbi:hypothetical protein N752_08740 [Desulforamulus aquiferis]|nr:hypothetical protein N752_08740 [Desulforamulus aquiferis]
MDKQIKNVVNPWSVNLNVVYFFLKWLRKVEKS